MINRLEGVEEFEKAEAAADVTVLLGCIEGLMTGANVRHTHQ